MKCQTSKFSKYLVDENPDMVFLYGRLESLIANICTKSNIPLVTKGESGNIEERRAFNYQTF